MAQYSAACTLNGVRCFWDNADMNNGYVQSVTNCRVGYNGTYRNLYILKFTTPNYNGSISESFDFNLPLANGRAGDTIGVRWAVATSDANMAAYQKTTGAVSDGNQIASGTTSWTPGATSTACGIWVNTTGLKKSTTYYLFVWPSSTNFGWASVTPYANHGITVYSNSTYTISYNANGGAGAPGSQSKVHGSNITLSGTKPTRGNSSSTSNGTITISYNANNGSTTPSNSTGTYTDTTTTTYSFKCWNTKADGTGTSYNSGDSYSGNADVTLYAIWTSSSSTARTSNPSITLRGAISRANSAANAYTVSFNANGGGSTPSSLTTKRTTVYTFTGWNTKADGTGTKYASSTAYTFSGNVTLYAQWSATTSNDKVTLPAAISRSNGSATGFNVSFNANGGASTPATITSSRTIQYAFQCWNTKADGTGTDYAASGAYAFSGNVTLYAKWTQTTTNDAITLPAAISRGNDTVDGFCVTLDPSGGTCQTASLTAKNTVQYAFSKWGAAASGGTTYAAGAQMTPTAAMTLYAQWTSTTTKGSVSLPTPTRNGYEFLGWAASPGAASGVTGSYTPSANVTLYAVWKALGLVYIENEAYQACINDNGEVGLYAPYLGNESGTAWDLLS